MAILFEKCPIDMMDNFKAFYKKISRVMFSIDDEIDENTNEFKNGTKCVLPPHKAYFLGLDDLQKPDVLAKQIKFHCWRTVIKAPDKTFTYEVHEENGKISETGSLIYGRHSVDLSNFFKEIEEKETGDYTLRFLTIPAKLTFNPWLYSEEKDIFITEAPFDSFDKFKGLRYCNGDEFLNILKR